MRAVRQNSGASSSRKKALLARPHSKHSSCWNPGASLYPNLQAIAQNLSGGNSVVVQQLVDNGKACIAPGLQYFHDRFSGELNESVASFKAAATLACCC